MRSLFVKVDGKYKGILFAEILYVEAFKNYVRIHTVKKVFLAHYTLKQIEEHLPEQLFCRVHKSFIIALDRLTEFDHESVFLNDVELPMASQYGSILKSRLNIIYHDRKSKVNDNALGNVIHIN